MARGWIRAESSEADACGALRVCFLDLAGEYITELERRSDSIGLDGQLGKPIDFVCTIPADERIDSLQLLWLQTGPARATLAGFRFSLVPLPGAFRAAREIRLTF